MCVCACIFICTWKTFQITRVSEEAANKMQPRAQFSCGEEKTSRRGGAAA